MRGQGLVDFTSFKIGDESRLKKKLLLNCGLGEGEVGRRVLDQYLVMVIDNLISLDIWGIANSSLHTKLLVLILQIMCYLWVQGYTCVTTQ